MLGRAPFRLAAIAALLLTLSIALAVNSSGARADGGEGQAPAVPEKRGLTYPNLGSHLDQLAAKVEEGVATAQDAAREAPLHRGESVAVTIYPSGNVDDVVKFLEDNGGDPRNVGEDYIEAYVPVSLLGPVSERAGVLRVREIVPPQPAQLSQRIIGNGPAVHGSQAWNAAGYSGQGVKVGIIDGFFRFSALRGVEVPSSVVVRCYTDIGVFTSNLADCDQEPEATSPWPECLDAYQRRARGNEAHGTIVAESLIDIAPGVTLYIANPGSRGDMQEAVDWMASQGVQVINYSASWIFDGPGDGTSPLSVSPLNTVDRAAANDILWVNSAGNSAQNTWFGGYSDPDGNRAIGFGGINDEIIDAAWRACSTFVVQLRWEDSWAGANTDLDLHLVNEPTGEVVFSSTDPQSGQSGQVPWEAVGLRTRYNNSDLGIKVTHFSGEVPDWIQIVVWAPGAIEHHTLSGSIGNPAESANEGLLAVGAARWYDTDTIEPFSSRGPAPDGREKPKPDIVGADCGETALTPLNERRLGFCGTSQASPHVAGMAALVRQRFPELGAVEVAEYLKDNARQREVPDPNNTWGHGFAVLPPIILCSNNPGLAADCARLLTARDALAGTGTLNWSARVPVEDWDAVTVGGSPLRVTELRLPEKGLTGEIPAGLGGLSNLEELWLPENQLTGEIPPELGGLANLEGLYLSGNQLSGTIPTQLGGLTNLKELSLTRNQLSGEIPPELAGLTGMERLALGGNQLTGTIPTWLSSLTSLEELHLWGNGLTGEIPPELGSLTNLRWLSLGENQLSGPIPVRLGSLANLTELRLDGNRLSGEIPPELGSPAGLERLWLHDNQLSGTIPPQLGGLTNLKELDLTRNQLSGEIPPELAGLASLEILALGGNQVTGTIPVWLGILANLEELHLWGNDLSGAIPVELDSLTNLRALSLGENQLSGEIPPELGSLARLEGLRLHNNRLTGEIPSELGSLANLTALRLDGNQLSGEIPSELGRLLNLTVLYLSGNQLSGCVPDRWGDVENNDFEQLGLSFCPGDPLINKYDTNRNGQIDRSEVIRAINDYLFGTGADALTRADVIRLINLYLSGSTRQN